MVDKYEMLKEYVNGVVNYKKDDGTLKEIKDLIGKLDQTEEAEKKKKENLISKTDWHSLGYSEKIKMKESNPERFNNAMAGNFKEEK
ncbi:hypothetical protein SAMN04488113_10472 [Alkalibacterium gilvum]|uniref:Uncharacterized protein n=1 Tax=Alkalibacterium gilvum TaxID=1130080 RepID=A0A1H6RSG5_9LACT|nr:hypothetical protein [Alkalibacterium gilvum]SEI58808.1 hypothetical protein SAMN04488113_10472 [Alkalibacterium gilvum]